VSRIRVLQVLDNLGTGGAQSMVTHLLRCLDSGRFEPRLVSLYEPSGSHLEEALRADGHSVIFLGKQVGFDPRILLRFDRVMRDFRPQIVHTHGGGLRYALPSILLRRVPVKLHTLHTVAENDALKRVNSMAFRMGVRPVAIADEVAASVLRCYGVPAVSNIPNGIPVEAYRSPRVPRDDWRAQEGVAAEDFVFATVSRLDENKNQQLMLRAFARAAGHERRIRLLIAGDGPARTEVERLSEDLGLQEQIRFLGIRPDVPELLAAIDAFVLSSNSEGNPLCVLEAMAAGRPVISTAVGGIPQLVQDGRSGLLTPPGDEEALSEAMLRLLNDPQLVVAMGTQSAELARASFDVGSMTRAYEDLYTSLLSSRG